MIEKKTGKTIYILVGANIGFMIFAFVCLKLSKEIDCFPFYSLFVTFLTISYHFLMRIIVGETVTLLYSHKEFNYSNPWFKLMPLEKKLYKAMRVKHWKKKVITAKPWQFDMTVCTKEEILHNMTQAEIVHEIIIILSFVPLLFIIPFGAPWVFVITSFFCAIFDGIFVVIQRYNRPRLMKIIEREKR